MARIKRRDTSLELRVRAAVYSLGRRYRVDVADLPGRPDLANKKHLWAIFVNGCFWHQHKRCGAGRIPNSNASYWSAKLMRNVQRDKANLKMLKSLGYAVLTVWECETSSEDLEFRLRRFFDLIR